VAKVVCPKCGRPGYLVRVKVRNSYYMRVEHWENEKRRVCYLGKDVSELRRQLEGVIGRGGVVAYSIAATTYSGGSSMHMIEIRFLGHPVRT